MGTARVGGGGGQADGLLRYSRKEHLNNAQDYASLEFHLSHMYLYTQIHLTVNTALPHYKQ
jgi:hypothetical protein